MNQLMGVILVAIPVLALHPGCQLGPKGASTATMIAAPNAPVAPAVRERAVGETQGVQLASLEQDVPLEGSNAQTDRLTGPQTLESLIALGLSQNPSVQRARLLLEAAAHQVPQAGALPDPNLQLLAGVSPVQTAAGPQDFALGMNQKFPSRGKRGARTLVAQEEWNVARSRVNEVETRVVNAIRSGYYQLYRAQATARILDQQQTQLELIQEVVQAMYEVKREVTQQDVLQVQVARSKLRSEQLETRRQIASARAQLAQVLHLSPTTELDTVDQLPTPEGQLDIEELSLQALQTRPELLAQSSQVQRDRNAVKLARMEAQPDLNLGFNWIAVSNGGISPVANGDDSLMLSMGMNLPVYRGRIQAAICQAEAQAMASQQEYERLRDETLASIADLVSSFNSLKESVALYRQQIIPRQQLSLEQSIDDYQVGKVDFLQMIDNWNQLLRYQIQEKQLEAELNQKLANLQQQLGDISATGMDARPQPSPDNAAMLGIEMDPPGQASPSPGAGPEGALPMPILQ